MGLGDWRANIVLYIVYFRILCHFRFRLAIHFPVSSITICFATNFFSFSRKCENPVFISLGSLADARPFIYAMALKLVYDHSCVVKRVSQALWSATYDLQNLANYDRTHWRDLQSLYIKVRWLLSINLHLKESLLD